MTQYYIDGASDAFFVSFSQRRLVHHLNSYQQEEKPLCLACNEYLCNYDYYVEGLLQSSVCKHNNRAALLTSSSCPAGRVAWLKCRWKWPSRIHVWKHWPTSHVYSLYSLCGDRASKQAFLYREGFHSGPGLEFLYFIIEV